jgi:hypothetical protein
VRSAPESGSARPGDPPPPQALPGDDREGDGPVPSTGAEGEPAEPAARGGTGAEDFRAVAPPVMSFAQGRRR